MKDKPEWIYDKANEITRKRYLLRWDDLLPALQEAVYLEAEDAYMDYMIDQLNMARDRRKEDGVDSLMSS